MDEIKMGEHQARNANTELLQQAEYCENECIVMKKFVTSSKQIQQLQADRDALLNACKFMHNAIGAGHSILPEAHRRISLIIKSLKKHQDSTQEG